MKIFGLSLMLYGLCFGQATRQVVSESVCSFNVSNVHGSVSTTINGPACNYFSETLTGLLQEDVSLLRENIEALKSQRRPNATLASFSSTGYSPLDTSLITSIYDTLRWQDPTDLNFITATANGQLSLSSTWNTRWDANSAISNLNLPNDTPRWQGPTDLNFITATANGELSLSSTWNTPWDASSAISNLNLPNDTPRWQGPTDLNFITAAANGQLSLSSTWNTPWDASSAISNLNLPNDTPRWQGPTDLNFITAAANGQLSFASTWNTPSPCPFASCVAASNSVVITGTDQLSLSKALSDVSTSGNTITSWTVAYRTDNLQ
jgi:hypothetical protein